MELKDYFKLVGIALLFFLGIPIKIEKIVSGNEERLFEEYCKKFNKTYNENDIAYLVKFENFKIDGKLSSLSTLHGKLHFHQSHLYNSYLIALRRPEQINNIMNILEETNLRFAFFKQKLAWKITLQTPTNKTFVSQNSLRLIEELNKNRSNHSAFYGLTAFSDLSQDEFIKSRLQKFRNQVPEKHFKHINLKRHSSHERTKRSKPLPLKVDWRQKGIISSIKNQKTCGACWAFSVIETAESMNALQIGSLIELSVQEVIDCARYGNFGCDGGDSCSLLDWLVATKTKITTQRLYPFIYKTGVCTGKKFKTGVQIQSFSCENFVDAENLLREKIAFHGPVAVAVNAINWQNYLGGIIQYHCTGAPQDLNHAVQIIGYDLTGPVPYYIARNSWGVEFGDKGYVYIAVGGNLCGLANEVTSLDVF